MSEVQLQVKLKRQRLARLGILAGLATLFLAAVAVALVFGGTATRALPTYNVACTTCHTQSSSIVVSPSPTSTTVTAGAGFNIAVSFSGINSSAYLSLPNVANNALFIPSIASTPWTVALGTATSPVNVPLTAPTTAGTYTVRTYISETGPLTNYADVTVTVTTPAPVTYTLTYTAGPNGSISGIASQTVASAGSGTAVTAVAATGYHFVNWSDGLTANPRTDTNVTASKSVTANFAINTYTLTYAAGANGSISGTVSQAVSYGGSGTAVTAVAATGYHFVNWSDGSTANPRTDTSVTASISVTANFAINTYTLIYAAGANGSLTGTASQTVNYGGSGTAVTAVAATGYHFVNWSDGSTANPRTDTSVTASISVTANFAANPVTSYTLTYTAGPGGSISGTASQTVASAGSGTAVTAVAATGYHFVNWSDGSTANPRTDTSVTASISVTANFAINTYTLNYAAGANGSLTGTASQAVNYGGSGTAVTAVAATGYHFVNWSDGSTANPRTDTSVTASISVTANFAANPVTSYTLTYAAGPGGSISGTASQTVASGGSGTAVTAVPATGYHFVNWSDGSTANPRTDTSVTASVSVTANFAANTVVTPPPPTSYTISVSASPAAGGAVSGGGSYSSGATVSLSATANSGYTFVNWTEGATVVSTGASYSFTASATRTLVANFLAVPVLTPPPSPTSFTITATAGDDGSITPSGKVTVISGASQSFSIVADHGYHVAWVLVDGKSTGAVTSYTFTNVRGNHTISVRFAPNWYSDDRTPEDGYRYPNPIHGED